MMRLVKILAAVLAGIAVCVALAVWLVLRASLPQLDGQQKITGLAAPVTLQRDDKGVPTISGATRADLARALGFAHAQDRFFQMDLQRRAAAGELSALLGASLLPVDEQLRPHRFRAVARAAVAALDAQQRALLEGYAEGVNAGLAALGSRPFEYWLLRSTPSLWRAEDSILCMQAMFLELQDPSGHRILQDGLLRAALPPAAAAFVLAGAPEWDAAVDESTSPAPVLPTPAQFDLRAQRDLPYTLPEEVRHQLGGLGSNNWAVAGSRTASGAALIANDMHLGFRVPVIWYRARLVQKSAGLDATGVTLPGTPALVAGSNGHVAWGFTNSYGQYESVIRLVPGDGRDEFRTAQGTRRLTTVDETLEVKGEPARHLAVKLSPWGPVMGKDWEGHPYVLAWTAQDPAALNLNLMSMERAMSVSAAIGEAAGFGIPAQNMVLGDSAGHIAWTIAGRIPLRNGEPGLPELSTDAQPGFSGWASPADQPRILDPPGGLLWSANARVTGGAAAGRIGDGGMDRGARAQQIHADLLAISAPVTPAASLGIQLDDRALFLARWRELLSGLLGRQESAGIHRHPGAVEVLHHWSGRALPSDAAYRLVSAFRAQVEARVFFMLVAPARKRAPDFVFEIPSSFEGPLWRMVNERPMHLLAPGYPDWDALFEQALSAAEQPGRHCTRVETCDWGRVNEVHIRHPLSTAIPWLAKFLDMPVVRLPGGREDMPRVQGPDYGASERFSVSPGYEQDAYYHMPGGQGGHPLSPFYRSDFQAWAEGVAAPFLPGPVVHALQILP